MNAYHISFQYKTKNPCFATLPGETPEEAQEKLMKMLEGYDGVEISSITDIKDVPEFQRVLEAAAVIEEDRKQKQAETSSLVGEAAEEPKVVN